MEINDSNTIINNTDIENHLVFDDQSSTSIIDDKIGKNSDSGNNIFDSESISISSDLYTKLFEGNDLSNNISIDNSQENHI